MSALLKSIFLTSCISFVAHAMESDAGTAGFPADAPSGVVSADDLSGLLKASKKGDVATVQTLLARADQTSIPVTCEALTESARRLALLNRFVGTVAQCKAPEDTGAYTLAVDHVGKKVGGDDMRALYDVLQDSCAYAFEDVSQREMCQTHQKSIGKASADFKFEVKTHYASAQERYEAARKGHRDVTERLMSHLKKQCEPYFLPGKMDAFFADSASLRITTAIAAALAVIPQETAH